jgi:hypothetical protein
MLTKIANLLDIYTSVSEMIWVCVEMDVFQMAVGGLVHVGYR